jgi:hypothetical protein
VNFNILTLFQREIQPEFGRRKMISRRAIPTLLTATVVVLFAIASVDIVNSFSVSVPPVRSVCRTMVPGHHEYKPQTSESPFAVSTDVNEIKERGVVEVTLHGLGNHTFKGFYLQARGSKNTPIGMFNSNSLAKTHSCGGVRSNAAHHGSPDEKSRVSVSWHAPAGYKGDIQFQATFVENFVHFWTPVKAPEVVKVG